MIGVYSGLDELIQQFRPYRSADVRDWFADLAGAAIPGLIAAAETWAARRRPAAVASPCPDG